MKRYKRAKLSTDAMNFIHANMALSYANTGNKEDKAVANRFLNLITSKAYSDNKWTYNIALAHYYAENKNDAASLFESTTTALLAATVPAVMPSNISSSASANSAPEPSVSVPPTVRLPATANVELVSVELGVKVRCVT